MKIVIDGVIFGLQKAGGISRIWCDLLRGYDESDHQVTVLVPTNSNEEWKELEKNLKKVRVIKRRRFRWGKRGLLDVIYLTLMALRLRPNVWHQTYYVGYPSIKSGLKVTTLHDMIPEVVGQMVPYDSKKKYIALKRSDKIVVISKHSASDLHRLWGFQEKTVVIPNGCSFAQEVNWQEKKKIEEPYLLYVGKRRGYKNFLPAVREILKERSFKIKAVGGEKPEGEELEIAGVEYLGVLGPQKLRELYAGASILLFPSLYEGFGMPILEAFASGVPVLAMRASCISEVVGEDYPLAMPGTIVETLERLFSEKERWVAYGKERQKLFTVEKMVENMLHLYEHAFFDHHNHI